MRKVLLCCLLLSACASLGSRHLSSGSEYLWLEEIEGAKALSFVKEHNQRTLAELKKDKNFRPLEKEIRKINLASDRLPYVALRGGHLYNFWQDKTHVRGLWRRTSMKSYHSRDPEWETVLDLDALAKKENENWVWKGAECLEPGEDRCLLRLSRGGKDASVLREFDLRAKDFVRGGFELPEAKSGVAWANENELYVATDFGPGSLTDSGYPMIVKRWKRGEDISQATEIFRGKKSDVSAGPFVEIRPEGTYRFLVRRPSFFETETWWEDEGGLVHLPLPPSADFYGEFQGQLLFVPREDLKTSAATYPAGSLLAIPLTAAREGEGALEQLRPHFQPDGKKFLSSVSKTRSFLLLGLLDNVKGKIAKTGAATNWRLQDIPLGGTGMAEVSSTETGSDFFLASYMDFLTPTSLYGGDASRPGGDLKKLKASPSRFRREGLEVEQREATSKDGTKIPYFLVHKKSMKLNGKNPTLLYGYGGFEISMTPFYSGTVGKAWLEKGGVYAVANIRGGGEFGPRWHEAALKENRQRAFDDFIAVAEDLIEKNVTSPQHLGIQGGSNGGLLVGATFVQRPDLFHAVLCEVPLLDMLRYHHLLAGASWMAEYGDPDDPAMEEAISRYSPFQNVKANARYPEVFFFTSTKDDRVHPGHARRMVAKMEAEGHKVYYYENTEGGHGGAANLEQIVLRSALEFTYLWKKLK